MDEELEFYTDLALQETERWIQVVTKKRFKDPDDPRKSLEDGILLCELLNCLKAGCIRKINKLPTPIAGLDNLHVFLEKCKEEFNLNTSQLFSISDLEDLSNRAIAEFEDRLRQESERRLRNVAITIYWLGRSVAPWHDGPKLDLSSFTDLVSHPCFQRGSARSTPQRSRQSSISSVTQVPQQRSRQSSISSVTQSAQPQHSREESNDSLDHSSAYGSFRSEQKHSQSSETAEEAPNSRDNSCDSVLSEDRSSCGQSLPDEKLGDYEPELDQADMPGRYDQRSGPSPGNDVRYSATFDSLYDHRRTSPMGRTGQDHYRSSPSLDRPGSREEYDLFRFADDTDGYNRTTSNENLSSRGASGDFLPPTRVTSIRTAAPAANPLQFIKTDGHKLSNEAKEVLEVMAKQKDVKKVVQHEEEDWQSKLGDWKSRRKSAGSYIRAQELEETTRKEEDEEKQRRKSKTYKEMMEQREKRRSLGILSTYPVDDGEDVFSKSYKTSNQAKAKEDEENRNSFGHTQSAAASAKTNSHESSYGSSEKVSYQGQGYGGEPRGDKYQLHEKASSNDHREGKDYDTLASFDDVNDIIETREDMFGFDDEYSKPMVFSSADPSSKMVARKKEEAKHHISDRVHSIMDDEEQKAMARVITSDGSRTSYQQPQFAETRRDEVDDSVQSTWTSRGRTDRRDIEERRTQNKPTVQGNEDIDAIDSGPKTIVYKPWYSGREGASKPVLDYKPSENRSRAHYNYRARGIPQKMLRDDTGVYKKADKMSTYRRSESTDELSTPSRGEWRGKLSSNSRSESTNELSSRYRTGWNGLSNNARSGSTDELSTSNRSDRKDKISKNSTGGSIDELSTGSERGWNDKLSAYDRSRSTDALSTDNRDSWNDDVSGGDTERRRYSAGESLSKRRNPFTSEETYRGTPVTSLAKIKSHKTPWEQNNKAQRSRTEEMEKRWNEASRSHVTRNSRAMQRKLHYESRLFESEPRKNNRDVPGKHVSGYEGENSKHVVRIPGLTSGRVAEMIGHTESKYGGSKVDDADQEEKPLVLGPTKDKHGLPLWSWERKSVSGEDDDDEEVAPWAKEENQVKKDRKHQKTELRDSPYKTNTSVQKRIAENEEPFPYRTREKSGSPEKSTDIYTTSYSPRGYSRDSHSRSPDRPGFSAKRDLFESKSTEESAKRDYSIPAYSAGKMDNGFDRHNREQRDRWRESELERQKERELERKRQIEEERKKEFEREKKRELERQQEIERREIEFEKQRKEQEEFERREEVRRDRMEKEAERAIELEKQKLAAKSKWETNNREDRWRMQGREESNEQQRNDNQRFADYIEKSVRISQKPNNPKGFGFAIKGGKEYNLPIYVDKVTLGSAADVCELMVGDEIVSINGAEVGSHYQDSVTHVIKQSVQVGHIDLKIRRSLARLFSPAGKVKAKEQDLADSDMTYNSYGLSTPTLEEQHPNGDRRSPDYLQEMVEHKRPESPQGEEYVDKEADDNLQESENEFGNTEPLDDIITQYQQHLQDQEEEEQGVDETDDSSHDQSMEAPPEPNWSTFPGQAPPTANQSDNQSDPFHDEVFSAETVKPTESQPSSHDQTDGGQKDDRSSTTEIRAEILRRKSEFLGLNVEETEEYQKIKDERERAEKEKEMKETKEREVSEWQKLETHSTASDPPEVAYTAQEKNTDLWEQVESPSKVVEDRYSEEQWSRRHDYIQQIDIEHEEREIIESIEREEKEHLRDVERRRREQDQARQKKLEEERLASERQRRQREEQIAEERRKRLERERREWDRKKEEREREERRRREEDNLAWEKRRSEQEEMAQKQRVSVAGDKMRAWKSMEMLKPGLKPVEIDPVARASRDMETLLEAQPRPAIRSSLRFFEVEDEKSRMQLWNEEQERKRQEKPVYFGRNYDPYFPYKEQFHKEQDDLKKAYDEKMQNVQKADEEKRKQVLWMIVETRPPDPWLYVFGRTGASVRGKKLVDDISAHQMSPLNQEQKLLEKDYARQRELEQMRIRQEEENKKRWQEDERRRKEQKMKERQAPWTASRPGQWRIEVDILKEQIRREEEESAINRRESERLQQEKNKAHRDQFLKDRDDEMEQDRLRQEEIQAQSLKEKEEKLKLMEENLKREAEAIRIEKERLAKEKEQAHKMWNLKSDSPQNKYAPPASASQPDSTTDYTTGEIKMQYVDKLDPNKVDIEYVYNAENSPPVRLDSSPPYQTERKTEPEKTITLQEQRYVERTVQKSYVKKEPPIPAKRSIKSELNSQGRDPGIGSYRGPPQPLERNVQTRPGTDEMIVTRPIIAKVTESKPGQPPNAVGMSREEIMRMNRHPGGTKQNYGDDYWSDDKRNQYYSHQQPPVKDPSTGVTVIPVYHETPRPQLSPSQPMDRSTLHSLSALPKKRSMPENSWIVPEDQRRKEEQQRRAQGRRSDIMRPNISHSSQHWLVEEAERRRRAEQDGKERPQSLHYRQDPYQQHTFQQSPGQQHYQDHYVTSQSATSYSAQQRSYGSPPHSGSKPHSDPYRSPTQSSPPVKRHDVPPHSLPYRESQPSQYSYSSASTPVTQPQRSPTYRHSYQGNQQQTVPIVYGPPLSQLSPQRHRMSVPEPVRPMPSDRGSAKQGPPSPQYAYPHSVSMSTFSPSAQPQYKQANPSSLSRSVDQLFAYNQNVSYTGTPGVNNSHSGAYPGRPVGNTGWGSSYLGEPRTDYNKNRPYSGFGQTPTSQTFHDRGDSQGSAGSSERAPPVPPKPPRLLSSSSDESHPEQVTVGDLERCGACDRDIGHSAAMTVDSLNLCYHVDCFRCSVCHARLGNGRTGAGVRVWLSKLHCNNCYSDQQGIKYSRV